MRDEYLRATAGSQPGLGTQGGEHALRKGKCRPQDLRKVAHRLDELGIPYAIAEGMALFFHGCRRFTEDVDILVRPEDLPTIHRELEGLGYLPPFAGSKQLRDTEHGVRVEFLETGATPATASPNLLPSLPQERQASRWKEFASFACRPCWS